MKRIFCLILFVFILSGCSETVYDDQKLFAVSKGSLLKKEKALTVQIFREKKYIGFLTKKPIYINQAHIVDLPSGRCLVLTLEPGTYSLHTGNNEPPVIIEGKEGEARYLKIHSIPRLFKESLFLKTADKDIGIAAQAKYAVINLTVLPRSSEKNLLNQAAEKAPPVQPKAPPPKSEAKSPNFMASAFSALMQFCKNYFLPLYMTGLFFFCLIVLPLAIRIYVAMDGPFFDKEGMIFFCAAFVLISFGLGCIPAAYFYHWIPSPLFFYYSGICLFIAAGLALFLAVTIDSDLIFAFFSWLGLFSVFFYLGFVPVKLILHFFPEILSWMGSYPWWKTAGIIFYGLILIALNIFSLIQLEDLQDYSGAGEISTSGFWATLSGNFYMNATKAQTGEWEAPVSSFIKFLMLNGALIGGIIYFTSSTTTLWLKIHIYAGLLALLNGLFFLIRIFK